MNAFRSFYGILAKPQSYLNLIYLLLAFPLGIFYFVFLVTGLSVGIATAIVWVGFLILALVGVAWLCLAAFERWLAIHVLRERLPAAPAAPLPQAPARPGMWAQVKQRLGDRVTWTSLLFLLSKLPIGILSFVAVVCTLSVTLATVLAPLAYQFRGSDVWDHVVIGPSWVGTMSGTILLAAVGWALFMPLSFHLMNALAAASGWWARVTLAREPVGAGDAAGSAAM